MNGALRCPVPASPWPPLLRRRQQDFPELLREAYRHTLLGRPGATYLDLPSNLLLRRASPQELQAGLDGLPRGAAAGPAHAPAAPAAGAVAAAAALLRGAARPLVVAGKGAALARAEEDLQRLANQ